MSKLGLLGYDFPFKAASNIGDYVQSLAALGQLGQDLDRIEIINRERLDEWDGGPIKLVMNGWFMHEPEHWPPHDSIDPVFVAFHVNPSVYQAFSSEKSIHYFRQHEPIGCRDFSTLRFMRQFGVESYFSGCLTLTLERDRFCTSESRSGVLICDVVHGKGSVGNLRARTDIGAIGKLLRLPRVLLEKLNRVNGAKIERRLHRVLVAREFETLTTQIPVSLPESERFALASRYLGAYASAELVVTSRIHVALPCLAFKTPVLFVDPGIDSSRFAGITDLFTTISIADFESMSDHELERLVVSVQNPNHYMKYRDALTQTVRQNISHIDAAIS